MKKILFVKPPDRFLDNEFVYQQLGPQFLQAYLERHDIPSDMLVLYESRETRQDRLNGLICTLSLDQLHMMLITHSGEKTIAKFDQAIFMNYDIVGISVMTPQAGDAYLLSRLLNAAFPTILTVIGGSHPRYYRDEVLNLPDDLAFDFVVPLDGWKPILQIALGKILKQHRSSLIIDNENNLTDIPVPSRPVSLLKEYRFEIAGVPAFHGITALGCPFSCNFCESGREKLRLFPESFIDHDLEKIAETHRLLGNKKTAIMFFDDVGLMNPSQVQRLSSLICKHGFTTWRAFTHAFLVQKYHEDILGPFRESGGRRIGLGLETGSQQSLDLINKRNGDKQLVKIHYEAVRIANRLGIAVDAFTMIYPWEDENDLHDTTRLIEFIAANEVAGIDEQGRKMKNHVDSTIMSPFKGTAFYDMISAGELPGVALRKNFDPSIFYYKGSGGGSGWPYSSTRLPRERYIEEQNLRNSFRPEYR